VQPLLNSGRGEVNGSEIVCVLFASESASKVSQFQVPKRKNPSRNPAVDGDQVRDLLR